MKEYEVVLSNMSTNETELERATISIPADLLEEGRERARGQRRSFSGYVTRLIERDLQSETEGELQPQPEEPAAA